MSKLILMLCAVIIALTGHIRSAPADQKYFKNGKWISLSEKPDGEPELEGVRELIRQGNYPAAYKAAWKIAEDAPDDATLWEARMLMGDLCVLDDEMSDARLHYDAVLNNAPENSRIYQQVLNREFELAWHWVVGGRKRKFEIAGFSIPLVRVSGRSAGLELLREIRGVRAAKDEELPVRTLLLAAEYSFATAQYDIAESEYRQLVDRFGHRSEALTARLQEAVCKLAQFRGTEYDLEGLRTARKKLDEFAQTNPDEAAKRDLDLVTRRIDWTFARRDYETGEFYRRLGDIRPAVRYYRYVVKGYPETPWQLRAKARLEELGADDFVESAEAR